MRGNTTKIGLSFLGSGIGFVVGCLVGALATEGYNALPEGSVRVGVGLVMVFGIPQVVAVRVGLRERRRGDEAATVLAAAAAGVTGLAVTCAVMALQALEPDPAQCGLAYLSGLFVVGVTAVVNAGWALVTTSIAVAFAEARCQKDSGSATTPN